ncbi:MAG: hypothetical protein LBD87_06925, partial [Prevotellaceae bacterium]|nr:hypothetical protein [Prevotellaceae bacterium]
SDCPPNVTANNGTYTFKGTPPFTLIESNGITAQTVDETTLATSALTITPVTIRDKTECPGVFCPYQGSDLYMDATHLCQQRTSGAQNWEAYIEDSRDNQIYRITQFTDGAWWFADNLSIVEKRIAICDGVSQYYGSDHPDCPTGWQIPSTAELIVRWADYNQAVNDPYGGILNNTSLYVGLRCYNGKDRWDRCTTAVELTGYEIRSAVARDTIAMMVLRYDNVWLCHCYDCEHESNHSGVIRCKRQL